MALIAKFIVANEENAYKVSEMAKQHYIISKQKEIDKEHSVSAFLNKANSFTREWLMSFEVTGEDEDRQEEPLALIVLVSANIPAEATGNKPLYIEKTIPATAAQATHKVIERALEIAAQRRHDIVWVEIVPTDTTVVEAYKNAGFKESGKKGESFPFTKNIA